MKQLLFSLSRVLIFLALALPTSVEARKAEAAPEPFEKRFELVLPKACEESWRAVGWRTNLMEARKVAQEQNRPVFLWIIVGNPHGCT